MAGAIRYIKFSGYYDKFDEWKEKTKAISRYKAILKYLKKEAEMITEYGAENDKEKMKIYEGNPKACDLLIIRLYDDNVHDAWKSLIDKYEVSDNKKESLNEVTNRQKK